MMASEALPFLEDCEDSTSLCVPPSQNIIKNNEDATQLSVQPSTPSQPS
jgi:hypothetical protein